MDLSDFQLIGDESAVLGDSGFVSFYAHQLASARVAWVNTRWFLLKGIDVNQKSVLEDVKRILLEEYAYIVRVEEHTDRLFTGRRKRFHADRYGATGLVPNGGSGRVGTFRGIQVKGIGQTPLIGARADWQHSHGCLFLEEAIREAIFGEILNAELPFSAVGTIAVIDTQISLSAELVDVDKSNRALSLRSFVLRPAHFQRATLFEPRFGLLKAQQNDSKRTEEVVRNYCSRNRLASSDMVKENLSEMFRKAAIQIAFCHTHQFYNGGFFSSNISVDGKLLDFGSARFICSSEDAGAEDDAPAFGSELFDLMHVISSVAFFFGKFELLSDPEQSVKEMIEVALKAYELGRMAELLKLWKLDEAIVESIKQEIWRIFGLPIPFDKSCLEIVKRNLSKASDEHLSNMCKSMNQLLSDHLDIPGNDGDAIQASKYMASRKGLDRKNIQDEILNQMSLMRENSVRDVADGWGKFVSRVIGENQRRWTSLPKGYVVEGQVTDGASSAYLLYSPTAKLCRFIIHTVTIEGKLKPFGHLINGGLDDQAYLNPIDDATTQLIECSPCCNSGELAFLVGETKVVIPTMILV